MTCKKSRRFCLLLAACFFLCSVSSFAEVCYSDEDHNELLMIFDELENINKQQATQINELETELSGVKSELTISEQETIAALSSFNAAEKSWQEERRSNTFKVLAAGGIGFMVGYIVYWILDAIHEVQEYRAGI